MKTFRQKLVALIPAAGFLTLKSKTVSCQEKINQSNAQLAKKVMIFLLYIHL
jgi:hypothetical protein